MQINSISEKGKLIIKEHEGLVLKPYLCPAGVPTIGYGSTYYENGMSVKIGDCPITEDRANKLLENTLKKYEYSVSKYVKKELNQNQFDSLVSFTYNLGAGNLANSTLLKRINVNPTDPDIAHQFKRWNKSKGRVLKGLTKRRAQEAELYFS